MKSNGKHVCVIAFAFIFALAAFSAVAASGTVNKSLPPLPDLTIERAHYDKTKQKVTAYLVNKGEVAAAACTLTLRATKTKKDAKNSETVKFEKSVPALGAGARLTLTFDLPAMGEFTFFPIDATVDSAKVVRETNENNNYWSFLTFGGSVIITPP